MNIPDKIEVTFTADHLKRAAPYGSVTGCVLCTALKDLGFAPAVGGYGMTDIWKSKAYVGNSIASYKAEEWFDCGFVAPNDEYNPALIGRTLTLTKVL